MRSPGQTGPDSYFSADGISLRTNLIDEVFTPQINQVRSLLVVCQVCAYVSAST
jgi:hypothetical protein